MPANHARGPFEAPIPLFQRFAHSADPKKHIWEFESCSQGALGLQYIALGSYGLRSQASGPFCRGVGTPLRVYDLEIQKLYRCISDPLQIPSWFRPSLIQTGAKPSLGFAWGPSNTLQCNAVWGAQKLRRPLAQTCCPSSLGSHGDSCGGRRPTDSAETLEGGPRWDSYAMV